MRYTCIYIFIALLQILIIVQSEFNPYADNGGTSVVISGNNFILMASGEQLSLNYDLIIFNYGTYFL
jgi:20S proteasome alpha/beta subunit